MCKKNLKNYLETVKYPCSLCPTVSTTAWTGAEDCHQQPSNYWWSGVCLATLWRQTNSCRCSCSHPYRTVILSIHNILYGEAESSWLSFRRVRDLGKSWLSNGLVPIWWFWSSPLICRKSLTKPLIINLSHHNGVFSDHTQPVVINDNRQGKFYYYFVL